MLYEKVHSEKRRDRMEQLDLAPEPQPSPFADEPVEELQEESVEEQEDQIEEPLDEDPIDDNDEEQSEDEDDLSDDEINELLDQLEDDESEEEVEEDQIQTVPHAALHKERERRKELQQHYQAQQTALNQSQERIKTYEDSLSAVEKQIKELGLEDVVKLDKPQEADPEIVKLKAEQQKKAQEEQVAKTVGDIRQEAAGYLEEYPMVKGDSPEHEEIVLGLSLAAMYFGSEMEEATTRAMDTLNKALISQGKANVRQKKPVRATPAKASVKRRTPQRPKPKAGDVKGFFDQMADDHLG